jgi:protein-L-isoaspartate(D-aspartate) O-methyltransferase
MTIEECRAFYAQEVRFAANVSSPELIEAFARVPREKYLGSGPWKLGSPEHRVLNAMGISAPAYLTTDDPRNVYHNVVVVLDLEKDINNGQPGTLARFIEALSLTSGNRVYHLGCGVGYYTAIIAEVVGSKGSVVASEVNPELAVRAKENLSHYGNVSVHAGDGVALDPGACDAILINAGATHPQPLWLERLNENGRLVLPLTLATSSTLGQGVLARIVRQQGSYPAQLTGMVAIFSCTSARDPQLEALVGKALKTGSLFKLKSVRRDAHEETDTCLIHGREVCVSSAG